MSKCAKCNCEKKDHYWSDRWKEFDNGWCVECGSYICPEFKEIV